MSYRPWTPRGDWERGNSERFDEEDLFEVDVIGHEHDARFFRGYPGFGPSTPAGYPHGPYVEPDMGADRGPQFSPYQHPGHMHHSPHHHPHHHPQQLAAQPQADEMTDEP